MRNALRVVARTWLSARAESAWPGVLLAVTVLLPATCAHAQKVVQFAAGGYHSLLVRDDGSVWAWGDGTNAGQLGDGATVIRTAPTRTNGLSGAAVVAAGKFHSVAVLQDGTVWTWGLDQWGQLGLGSLGFGDHPIPKRVAALEGVAAVAAGRNHTVATNRAGSVVWAWGGREPSGQTCDGGNVGFQTLPVGVPGISRVAAIAAGDYHTLILKKDGSVWGCGPGAVVGDVTSAPHSSPVQITGLSSVIAIAAGGNHSLALTQDGAVWAWGSNSSGQIGDGTTANSRVLPVKVPGIAGAIAISAGYGHSVALTQDGSVWTWGQNDSGQLGVAVSASRATPARVSGLPKTSAISAGESFTLAGTPDGAIYAFGANSYAQIGNGDAGGSPLPVSIPAVSNAIAVAAGSDYGLALKQDGSVWGWGGNDLGRPFGGGTSGRFCDNSAGGHLLPAAIGGLSGIVKIAAGGRTTILLRQDGVVLLCSGGGVARPVTGLNDVTDIAASRFDSLVLKADGTVWQLSSTGSPTQVPNLTGITAISVGEGFLSMFVALKGDGTVWTWGYYPGNGNRSRDAPAPVLNLPKAAAISAGAGHTLVLSQDGTVWGWGDGGRYPLMPVQVAALSDIASIAAGGIDLALGRDGMVRTWGNHADWQGNDSNVPQVFPWLTGTRSIAAGDGFAVALRNDGRVVGWGDNSASQLAIPRSASVISTPSRVADPMLPVDTANAGIVTEYFNDKIGAGHYFITASAQEANSIDAGGSGPGWSRTSRTWRAWRKQSDVPGAVDATPVSRFYAGGPGTGPNSHFYTAEPAERNALLAQNPTNNALLGWALESTEFYTVKPVGGTCPAGYYPIYRAYDDRFAQNDSNHRISANYIDIFRAVRFFGWKDEGVTFCSPRSTVKGGDLHAYHAYPGDSVAVGTPITVEFLFANAGPGDAGGAIIYGALDQRTTWTLVCTGLAGGTCPPIGDSTLNVPGYLTPNNLRDGIGLPGFPAGAVLRITATAHAPGASSELIFGSAVLSPSGAPDPLLANNSSAGPSKTVVKSLADCIVSLSSNILSVPSAETSARVAISVPGGCAWTVSSDQSWLSITPNSGTQDATLTIAVAGNPQIASNDAPGRSARATAVATTAAGANPNRIASLDVSQSAPAQAASIACQNVHLGRQNEQLGANIVNGSVEVIAPSASCTWGAVATVPWVNLAAGATGKGSALVKYQVLANDGQNQRSGSIVIADQRLDLLQSGQETAPPNSGDGGGDGGGSGSGGGSGGGAG